MNDPTTYHFLPPSPDDEPLWSSDYYPLQPMETFNLGFPSSMSSSSVPGASVDGPLSSEPQSSTTTTPVPMPPVPVAAPQQPPEPPFYLKQAAPAETMPTINEAGTNAVSFDANAASTKYNTWTCKKLSEELGRRLLARSGNKPILIARLVEDDLKQLTTPPSTVSYANSDIAFLPCGTIALQPSTSSSSLTSSSNTRSTSNTQQPTRTTTTTTTSNPVTNGNFISLIDDVDTISQPRTSSTSNLKGSNFINLTTSPTNTKSPLPVTNNKPANATKSTAGQPSAPILLTTTTPKNTIKPTATRKKPPVINLESPPSSQPTTYTPIQPYPAVTPILPKAGKHSIGGVSVVVESDGTLDLTALNNQASKRPRLNDSGNGFRTSTVSVVDLTSSVPRTIARELVVLDEDDVYFGYTRVQLVGLQYYSGHISKGENVLLQRQPQNSHDKNAIAVVNISGQQVGHLERETAAIFAPLIDGKRVRIEGIIPKEKAPFAMPIILNLYGNSSDKDFVTAELAKYGVTLLNTPIPELVNQYQDLINLAEDAPAEITLDTILSISLDQSSVMPTTQPDGIVTTLFPHQLVALAWMTEREKVKPQVLFWAEGPNHEWVNTVTYTTVTEVPNDIRGGILADEMGVGKTLELVSLIANTPLSERTGPTLIICPLSTLGNWEDQLFQHCAEDTLTTYVYHGPNRCQDLSYLVSKDIIITTYNIVSSEWAGDGQQTAPLFLINWMRVVLDEAHIAKNPNSQLSKALCSLKAERKWCITGTPIQNKIDDLYSLVRFLGLDPFSDPEWWNRLISRTIKTGDVEGFARLKSILQHICIRRTKEKHVALPPREITIEQLEFSPEEKDYYDMIWNSGKAQFDKYRAAGTVLQHYAHVLLLLLRARQICDHMDIYKCDEAHSAVESAAEEMDKLLEMMKEGDFDECCICMESGKELVVTNCAHMFCRDCITQSVARNTACPLCRTPIKLTDLKPLPSVDDLQKRQAVKERKKKEKAERERRQYLQLDPPTRVLPSSKIKALIHSLQFSQFVEPGVKSLVFSQFTSFMDLIEECFIHEDITYVRLDGRMNDMQRQNAINEFVCNPNISVFLISLKTGGVGLNLVAASRVYLMDPWWNPAVEEQAIDRVHRLGQTKPVKVIKYVMKGSIEERISKLSERKKVMVRTALEARSRAEVQEMRMEELNLLFEAELPE